MSNALRVGYEGLMRDPGIPDPLLLTGPGVDGEHHAPSQGAVECVPAASRS